MLLGDTRFSANRIAIQVADFYPTGILLEEIQLAIW